MRANVRCFTSHQPIDRHVELVSEVYEPGGALLVACLVPPIGADGDTVGVGGVLLADAKS